MSFLLTLLLFLNYYLFIVWYANTAMATVYEPDKNFVFLFFIFKKENQLFSKGKI